MRTLPSFWDKYNLPETKEVFEPWVVYRCPKGLTGWTFYACFETEKEAREYASGGGSYMKYLVQYEAE